MRKASELYELSRREVLLLELFNRMDISSPTPSMSTVFRFFFPIIEFSPCSPPFKRKFTKRQDSHIEMSHIQQHIIYKIQYNKI